VRNHVKRSVLRRNILPAGLLARETEIVRSAAGGVAGYGARADDGDLGAAAWVSGVVDKGHVPFVPSFARTRFANMPCFYVGGEDTKTGLGVAYASELPGRAAELSILKLMERSPGRGDARWELHIHGRQRPVCETRCRGAR